MHLQNGQMRPRQIVWPRTPQGFRVLLLGECITGTYTHFDHLNFVSVLCSQTEECAYCRQGWLVRWKGFAAGVIAQGQEVVVELSELAALQVLKACGPEKSPRGLDVHLRREDKRKNAPVLVEVYQRLDPATVPPEFDTVGVAIRLFGLRPTPWAATPRQLFRAYYRYEELSLESGKGGVG